MESQHAEAVHVMDDVPEMLSVEHREAIRQPDNTLEYVKEMMNSDQPVSESEGSICGSQADVIELDGYSLKLNSKEKTLIERYKTLERLMKKKKMLGQVEESNKCEFSRLNSEDRREQVSSSSSEKCDENQQASPLAAEFIEASATTQAQVQDKAVSSIAEAVKVKISPFDPAHKGNKKKKQKNNRFSSMFGDWPWWKKNGAS